MGFFDFLPLGGTSSSPKTPTFKQGNDRDSTDLQIRSLLYLFKRLRVNRLASFPEGGSLKYTDGKLWDQSIISNDSNVVKLDSLNNLKEFQKILLEDEYRVLIDWPRNKFRSLCILSERPPLPEKSSSPQYQQSALPTFEDYRERPVHGFAFSVLPVNSTLFVRNLAVELALSLLYMEHHSYISLASRIQAAESVISAFAQNDSSGSGTIELTEDTKASIVQEYLRKLAFLVQLVRIYQQYTRQKEAELPPSSPKKAVLADSPRGLRLAKSFLQLPNATKIPPRPCLSPKKSVSNLNHLGCTSPKKLLLDGSPPKPEMGPRKQLMTRPSIANFRANEIYNPVTSPQVSPMHLEKEAKNASSPSLLNYLSETGKEQSELWEKCKASIREKLTKEKAVIAKHSG